uniref:Fatty-acid amide hydrolase 2 n=1 Tax=Cacopsylla melanoneura TaxID=428564 RepID=A0A8D9ALT7_9HEMI
MSLKKRDKRDSPKSKSGSPRKKRESSRRQVACNLLTMFLVFLRSIIDWCIDFVFSFLYEEQKFQLPPVENELLLQSATSIATKIKNKEISCEEVVRLFIERIELVNFKVNAVVDNRFPEAIAEAKLLDKQIAQNEVDFSKKPFLGVPFTSKESTGALGLNFSIGSLKRKHEKAKEDAFIVERLKSAGAILLGVTNVPELCLWSETRNMVFGQTNNPYNLSRTVGGSSGGEAAIVTACGSPLGLGTDIGGSCRMPGFYCGVYGYKLTTGYINTRGMGFRNGKESKTMVSGGPIVKHAEDMLPFIKCLVIPEKLPLLKLDKTHDLKQLKVFYIEQPGDLKVSAINGEMVGAIKKCVRALDEITEVPAEKLENIKQFEKSYVLWRYWMSKEPGNYASDLVNSEGAACWWLETIKVFLGVSQHTLPAIMKLIDMQLPLPKDEWAQEETDKLRKKLTDLLADDGVLIFPPCPTPATYHYTTFFRPYNFAYWAIFNVLGFPVVNVPVGLSRDGLPLGVQIVASTNNDKLCIDVANYLEKQSVIGWEPPFRRK